MATTNETAQTLKALHQRAHKPLVLANVYDILSARAVAELPSSEALATASYAVARAAGTTDDDMTLQTNLDAVRGPQLEDAIDSLIDLGVAGVNLEDADKDTGRIYDSDMAVSRIKRILTVARNRTVPDFVVNARCDVLMQGGALEEVLVRGKKYLEAGATTVFVLGGSKRGVTRAEVEQMALEFNGKLNVSLKMTPDGLTVRELAEIGVARISVGPSLQFLAMATYKKEAEKLLSQV
ncbi:phosphoenolpyruvate phosphomutase-domain-containing protein [Coniochaeta sp. 2T2.1]|nr:phosphoenolpyruvate phosphomutase-domain-containing protein [Coniochaeta sp. 2T2.1]